MSVAVAHCLRGLVLGLLGNEGMDKKMEMAIMGYIGFRGGRSAV